MICDSQVAQDTPAPPLSRGGGVLVGEELTIFGGMNEENREASDDTYILDLPTMSWHTVRRLASFARHDLVS